MKRIFISLWVLATFAGYVSAEAPEIAPTKQTATATVADLLNARYNSSVVDCANGTPAYHCSGVLIRQVNYSPNYDFWTHSPAATALGSTTFSFIRNGVNSNSADMDSGYIVMDPQDARSAGKMELDVRCIYPFMAATQGQSRGMYGCGFVKTPSPEPLPSDLSTCATLATPAVTPQAWIAHFKSVAEARTRQCSLSTRIPAQFMASLTVRASFPEVTRVYANEVLIKNWETNAPEQLPIEAFFYNTSKPAGLENAQAIKYAYLMKTGISLPIVRLDFSTGAKRFTLITADQDNGPRVARQLAERYADIRNNCGDDSQPAFRCSGLILRATGSSAGYDPWNSSDTAIRVGGVSFSFLRADYNMQRLAGQLDHGFLLMPESRTPPGKYTMEVMCFFPVDGTSNHRDQFGCGANTRYPNDSRPCALQGITTGELWRDHFNEKPTTYDWRCGFDVRGATAGNAFYEGMRGGRLVLPYSFDIPNDLKIRIWPDNIPATLPIEAFFYTQAAGLVIAKKDQQRFFDLTGIVLPIIAVQLSSTSSGTATFAYSLADQSVTPQ